MIPFLLHPWWGVLGFYFLVSAVLGLVLSVVFQLAHVVENMKFHEQPVDGTIEQEWSIHQIESCADFAPRNKLLNWYLGGLNLQTIHHLYPNICHVHYSALQPIVEQTCKDFGVRYTVMKSFREGVASHYRWLKQMGKG